MFFLRLGDCQWFLNSLNLLAGGKVEITLVFNGGIYVWSDLLPIRDYSGNPIRVS